ncbi:methylenetetrahydrofolate reductase [NAD(P)H] [Flavobacterium sp. JP2137]|uniref:methylenetetrahydrofolate reductase [NAD(P)H] n=1 Tax=Flavobacterium sp. JP2137 TaxID=3414510 RepID=UPI003D2FC8EF
MKVTEHFELAQAKARFSIEILPPLKGQNIQRIYDNMEPLLEVKPAFIDVTYHREEFVYIEKENGLLEKKIVKKRPGTVGICAAIQEKYKIDAVPHILCGGFTQEDTENFLIDLDFLGIQNVVALRGDAIKNETYFRAESKGHHFANELVTQIHNLNNGIYLDADLENSHATDFCIGVGAYPEKHLEAPSLDEDIRFLKQKVDAGADYIITQMFFDNQKYFEFVQKCRAADILVPIIPGLKPITTKRQLNLIPHRFKVDFPEDLVGEINRATDNAAVAQIGLQWCKQQSQELLKAGIPLLHYYSMGQSNLIQQIVKELF